MRKNITYLIILFFCILHLAGRAQPNNGSPPRTYTSTSVLHTGTWYKIGVTNSGIHKIDKNFLQTLGLPVNSLDPRNIKVYGNGGGMLPQANSIPRPDDLLENAVWVAGEADGKMDDADYILFYASGPHQWKYNASANRFVHENNIYSDTTYYFLTVGNTPGQRIPTRTAINGSSQTITTFTDHFYHEQDLVNMLQSGREWFGEHFNSSFLSRDFSFQIPGILPNSELAITASLMGNAPLSSSFQVKANNMLLGVQNFTGRGSHDYHLEGEINTYTYKINRSTLPAGDEASINLTYNLQGSSDGTGYLNYLSITAQRALRLYGKQTAFRSLQHIGPNNTATFQIENIDAATVVWDITNRTRPAAMPLQVTNNAGLFTAKTDSLREYIAFSGSDFPKPIFANKITNQNLHALNLAGNLDFIILAHPAFLPQAERLATHRRTHDQLEVAVVTTTQVYNEFSSGSQDVTAIRDFIKMIYDRSKKKNSASLYLLLFGDASYDYKSSANTTKARTPNNTNFVPVYESYESLNPLATYSSEDYFGFLDDAEGAWAETQFNAPELLDIGIGRLPVRTVAEAESMVNKIIHYDSPAGLDKWRNRIAFIADDGDRAEHLEDAESLANYLEQNTTNYNIRKVYLDMFPQEAVANGQRSAVASQEIDKAIEQGALITNYTGHGSESGLAHEQILTAPQISKWQNQDRLTFLLMATCEFGRYDDPKRHSGAELALLNPGGGAIGMLSTTRPVFASSNRILNRNFIENTFQPVNGVMPRFGDLMRMTKNKSPNQLNNRNFALLGDPTQRLAYPEFAATITHINAKPIGPNQDTLQALSKITLSGAIIDKSGLVVPSFDGKIQITVFEKKEKIKTFGDESSPSISNVREIGVRNNSIYDGVASVKNGLFTVSFVVPKDINYQTDFGKISLYADNQQTDAHGSFTNILVGGSARNSAADTKPPRIRLFMDDTTFVSGGLTNKDTYLLAKLYDESGINTTGTGIGHDITAILDNDKSNPIVLNAYYLADIDKFESGNIQFLLKDLAPGKHQITLKAWDTFNNSAESSLIFYIPDPNKIALDRIINFPSPFSESTSFSFNHNQAGKDIDIHIQIFNVTGKLVKEIQATRLASNATVSDITWDGKNSTGQLLDNGVYPYRVIVRSRQNNTVTEQHQKLIILK